MPSGPTTEPLPPDGLGDPIASSFAQFTLNTGEALADGYATATLAPFNSDVASHASAEGAVVTSASGATTSYEGYVPGAAVSYAGGQLSSVLGVPLPVSPSGSTPSFSMAGTWEGALQGVSLAPWASAITSTITLNFAGGRASQVGVLPFFDPSSTSAPQVSVYDDIKSNEQSIPPDMRDFDPVYQNSEALHDLQNAAASGSSVSASAITWDIIGTALTTTAVCEGSAFWTGVGIGACVAIGVAAGLLGGVAAALYYLYKAVSSLDPNDMEAIPAGAGSSGWIAPQPLEYFVRFENDGNAPAANVRVSVVLDPHLDQSTLQIGAPSQSSFAGTEVNYDPATRVITWEMPGVDLAPGQSGWVSFVASPVPGIADKTAIDESADVYFDYNPAVVTPTVTRTIDTTPPTVSLNSLPPSAPPGALSVSWSANSQVGVADFVLYESVDGGPLLPVAETTATSTTVDLAAGHTYGFAVGAVDLAGLSSAVSGPEVVEVSAPATTRGVSALSQSITFTSAPPSPAFYGGTYTPRATGGGSGNPVVFSVDASSTPGACMLSSGVVHFTGLGACVIDANQAGNAAYLAAREVQQSFTIIPVQGYWLVSADGKVNAFGAAQIYGSLVPKRAGPPSGPTVGIAATPDDYGYWLVSANGTVTGFGDAAKYCAGGKCASLPNLHGRAPFGPIAGIAANPAGQGYWLVSAKGKVSALSGATSYGSLGNASAHSRHVPGAGPVVAIAPTPDGGGYWLVSANGTVTGFGDAAKYASLESSLTGHGRSPQEHVVGMAALPK